MKSFSQKLILFSFLLLEVVTGALAANPEPAPNIIKTNHFSALKPKVSISFIIARRRDCEGFGICNLQVGISDLKANQGNGTLYLDDVNKSLLILEIDKATGITRDCYTKYFSSGTYLMEDAFILPVEVARGAGLSGPMTISAGRYPITERNGVLFVAFPLK